MNVKNILTAVFSIILVQQSVAQAPSCGADNFYELGINNCIWTYTATNPTSPNGFNPSTPSGAVGLAIGPNFFAASPAITFYTVLNGIYYYYNGSTFVSTGHSSGGTGFDNPGGSANYIYNIASNGQVSRYNGTGPATIIATYTNFTGGNVSQDIAGDANDNYYIVKTSAPASISCFNSASNLIASYPLSNVPSNAVNSLGFSINKGYVTLSPQIGGGAVSGRLLNNEINFGPGFQLACGGAIDMATCPDESYLVPAIRGVPSGSLPCNGGTITLTSDDLTNAQTYTWSGPGIVGATNSQNIIVNATGVYTRTMVTVGGITDVSTFTVSQGNWLPLQVAASSTVKCDYSPAISLTANGLGNYVWTPAASLSSATGSLVTANPAATTNYTVSGSLNGCIGSTVITITAAAPIQPPIIAVPNPSICVGGSGVLTTNAGSLNILWSPGSYTTNFIIITPTVSTVYTLEISNSLGCSKTTTTQIDVFTYPNVIATASQTKICEAENVSINLSGASNYTLLPNNLNGNVITLNPLASTMYTIIGANWNCSTTQQIYIDVMPAPQFSISSSVNQLCQGQSAIISSAGTGNTYTLLPGTIGGNTFAVSPQTSIVYTVIASNQSCTATQQLPITVNALPQLSVSSSAAEICVGESAVITASGAITYSWANGANTAQQQVSPATTTIYQVSGSSSEGCQNTITIEQRVSACTGIEKTTSESSIRFYPNPGQGIIEIEVNSAPVTARVEVRNYLGQLVFTSNLSERIDISAFEKGIYIVSVVDGSTTLYHTKYVLQ